MYCFQCEQTAKGTGCTKGKDCIFAHGRLIPKAEFDKTERPSSRAPFGKWSHAQGRRQRQRKGQGKAGQTDWPYPLQSVPEGRELRLRGEMPVPTPHEG